MKNKAELTKMAKKNFHFALTPPILPPDGPIFELLQNLSYRYSKDAACYSVHEEKDKIARRCQITLILSPPKWPIFGTAKPIIDLKTTANHFTFQVDEHAQMTSLEARTARCARQNLQNGQIIFFHFCPENAPFCPKMGSFLYFYKPVIKVFKRCSLLSCARRKRENLHTDVK